MFARVKRAFAPPDEELERAKRAAEVDASAFREVDESRAQKVVRPACAVPAASRTRFRELRTASDVSRDVDVFACAAGADDGTPCVFDVLNSRCASLGGKQCLRAVLGRPLLDGELLRARVSGLRRVHARLHRPLGGEEAVRWRALSGYAGAAPAAVGAYETDALWLVCGEERCPEAGALYDMAFFRSWPLCMLNRYGTCVATANVMRAWIAPALSLGPLLYALLPSEKAAGCDGDVAAPPAAATAAAVSEPLLQLQLLLRPAENEACAPPSRWMPWAKVLACVLSAVFYAHGTASSWEISRALRLAIQTLVRRTRGALTFLGHASAVVQTYYDPVVHAYFPSAPDPSAPRVAAFIAFHTPGPQTGTSFENERTNDHGYWLSAYKRIDASAAADVLRLYYCVDALLGACTLVPAPGAGAGAAAAEGTSPAPGVFSFPEFVVTRGGGGAPPEYAAGALWHPCLDPGRAVPNDVALGRRPGAKPNLLLTGPNAGGKSTLLKAVVISVLLSQSVGVAPCCNGLRLTPMAYVNAQINVPDVKGKRSLFEEEMHRARESLRAIDEAWPAPALVVIDELFASTNPVEGAAGAYATAKHLGARRNAACLLSTHYPALRVLGRTARYAPMQMPLAQRRGKLTRPYVLRPGTCEQYVALEMLARDGFDEKLLRDAVAMKRALLFSRRNDVVVV